MVAHFPRLFWQSAIPAFPPSFPRRREPRYARATPTPVIPAAAGTSIRSRHSHPRHSRAGGNLDTLAPLPPPSFPRRREPRYIGTGLHKTWCGRFEIPAFAGMTRGRDGGEGRGG
ncbi:MAG TPA: hypothetical protein ENJ79_10545 [Gammaproteobacteria bacterium]|nr:hypothetical protein [Gammaproteobacteria bacterium]